MTDQLYEVRERIYRKAREYFVYVYERRAGEKWRMFYGALDALHESGLAARGFGTAGPRMIACYGFLQALYVQQDAVCTLSRSVGIRWHPKDDPRVAAIRDVRNRLTGHPSESGRLERPQRLSSAIIPEHEISATQFSGQIYYEDGSETIVVKVADYLEENETRLAVQMTKVEERMDADEKAFRAEHAPKLFARHFGTGFDYLMRRLQCRIGDEARGPQAHSHARMIKDIVVALDADLTARSFSSSSTDMLVSRTLRGLVHLERLSLLEEYSEDDQNDLDLIYEGVRQSIEELQEYVGELDRRLSANPT